MENWSTQEENVIINNQKKSAYWPFEKTFDANIAKTLLNRQLHELIRTEFYLETLPSKDD